MSIINNRRVRATCISAAVATLTAFAGSNASAAPLDISNVPLFLTTGVQPNLMMAIDDSGSMDFEVLFPGNDGAAWWRSGNSGSCGAAGNNSFVGCVANGSTDLAAVGRLNFNNSGNAGSGWKKYSYLFPNGYSSSNTTFRRRLRDDGLNNNSQIINTNSHYAIPPLPDFAWARSPVHNTSYFDPALTYAPWPDGGGYTFTDSSPTAARFDPVFGTATDAINLTQDYAGTGSVATSTACGSTLPAPADDYYFRVYAGMTLPAGTCFRPAPSMQDGNTTRNVANTYRVWQTVTSGNTCAVGSSNGCRTSAGTYTLESNWSVAVRYFPATFYLPATTALPTGFGYKATATPLAGTAPDGTALKGYEIKPSNFDTPAQYTAAIQNFANWFTYYRKRHQALRAGLGDAFNDLSGMRVDGFTISSNTYDVTMGSIDVAANRTALYTKFYRDWIRSGGTPNRAAVANLVRNYKRTGTGAPVQYACQRNFGMLFTDGFSDPPAATDGFFTVGNVDGGRGDPFQDGVSNTMADGVMGAYINPIRTDLDQNKVKVPEECNAQNVDPRLDCNNDPHMNFYAVTLNARGLQFNPDANPPQDPFTTAPTWPTSFPARHPSAVDDLWHATINGRGKLLNAKNPQDIAEKLKSVLANINEQEGSAASASLNSGSIRDDTMLFQAKFDSRDWSGGLLAYSINTDGTIGALEWDAADEMPAASSRQIVTVGSTGTPIPFQWTNINADTTRRGQLDSNATVAQSRLNYLRGDASNEGIGATQFRVRSSRLGDIVNSAPTFVGAPRFSYKDTLEAKPYSKFRLDQAKRSPVVYVGANDGMLHAFDGKPRRTTQADGPTDSGGDELFAFIPSPVFRNLRLLSEKTYTHRFYVDGSPNAGDAYINNEWRTVVVGGLNAGGQGIYALDVTDPGNLKEANAAQVVMWEFTDADDADLGYTYSQPQIVRLRNGAWGAVFGNGYNNTEDDTAAGGAVSATGNAVLYVVDLEDGSLLAKIDTGYGTADDPTGQNRPNGLSTPAAVDLNGDSIVDFVYAGDLFGNMWKFDLRSTDPGGWKSSFGTAASPLPFFRLDPNDNANPDTVQPITSRPEVMRGPRGVGMMVLFGTGKYMETADKTVDASNPEVQAHYGLFDRNAHNSSGVQDAANRITTLAELTQQKILVETSVNGIEYRVTSNNAPITNAKGWYMNLLSPNRYEGERQVSNTIVRSKRVIFTTLIPDPDPCGAGGTSWLMELDALTGARLNETPFDVSGPVDKDNNTSRDGKFDEHDFVDNPEGGGKVAVGGTKLPVGISPTSGVLMSADGTKEYKYNPGTTGAIAVTTENPGKAASGRQSWRQVR